MADTDLIERLKFHVRHASETQAECTERKNAEREEAATALAEQDARIVELEAELEASRFAERNGKSLAEDGIHAIRELLKVHDVPVAAFIDDHVGNAIAQRDEARAELTASRAECEGLRAIVRQARELLAGPLVGVEWKRACHDFIDTADAALSQKETGA